MHDSRFAENRQNGIYICGGALSAVGCVIEKSKQYHGLVVRGEAAQVIQAYTDEPIGHVDAICCFVNNNR